MSNQHPLIRRAYEDIWEQQRQLCVVIEHVAPVGSFIDFERRYGVVCRGEVLEHDGHNRVKVRSSTGKEYWISAFSIQEPKP